MLDNGKIAKSQQGKVRLPACAASQSSKNKGGTKAEQEDTRSQHKK